MVTSLGFLDSFNPKKLICEVIVTRLSNEKLMNSERTKTLKTTSVEITLLFKKLRMQRSRNKSVDIYNYCKQKGHQEKQCKKTKINKIDATDVKNKNEQRNVVESNEQDGKAFVCVLATSCESNIWYIYSITSSHLLHCKD